MFTPYNPNPRGINTGDCVIRAICKAMDKTWEKVYTELTVKGLQEAMWGDTNTVWEQFLKENGFVKELLPNTCPDNVYGDYIWTDEIVFIIAPVDQISTS